MNERKKSKKRPLSHNPLLNFSQEENFLYSDPKFMNEELWKRKYNLRKLHEKWKRKVKTNFLNIDLKFGRSRDKKNKLNKIIYRDIAIIKSYNIPQFIPLSPSIKTLSSIRKKEKIDSDKYNDKISYYLSNKNPWNSNTKIDKKIYIDNFIRFNKTKNDLIISKNLKNRNESKNIKIKCNYYNNRYIQKMKKLKDLINKYESDLQQEISKKYIKEIKLKRHGKQDFKKYLIFKEMILKYQKLYKNLPPFEYNALNKCKSDIHIKEKKKNNKKNNIDNEAIYEELYIIINYLKEHKEILKYQKDNGIIVNNYFDVIEKDEYLRDKNSEYQKYIINLDYIDNNKNNNNAKEKENYENINAKSLLTSKKKSFSCSNLKNISNIKKKFIQYNISYYHPGTYYLFNKGDGEYHAWSCCMNEKKTSQGCSKIIEKIPIFNYYIIM